MDETGVLLNRVAQGLTSLNAAAEWFENLAPDARTEVLSRLHYYLLQAGARTEDVPRAIAHACLRPTFTPCVLLGKDRLKV